MEKFQIHIRIYFSIARRPIRGIKSRNSNISMQSVNYSSEEGEASEYPSSSQRSTLESNPESKLSPPQTLANHKPAAAGMSANHRPGQSKLTDHLNKMSLDGGSSESEDGDTVTLAGDLITSTEV